MHDGDSIIIPRVSSENRRYVPMGFIGGGNKMTESQCVAEMFKMYSERVK